MTMKKEKKKQTNKLESVKDYLKLVFKVVKPSRLIVLIVLVLTNTFGWFIFSTKVSTSLDVHVKAWDVLFEAGSSPIVDYVYLTVDNIFPGMEDYHYNLSANNRGEMDATVHYTILEFSLFGSMHYTVEGREEAQMDPVAGDYTSAQLEQMLANNALFPFTVTMGFNTNTMQAIVGHANFKLDLVWPYESGHDAQDTQLGQQAYTFKQNNPNTPCITFKVKMQIQQVIPPDNNSGDEPGNGDNP